MTDHSNNSKDITIYQAPAPHGEWIGMDNGCARSTTGEAALAIDPVTWLPRPVLVHLERGYQPDRRTVQAVAVGDLVLTLSWDARSEDRGVARVTGFHRVARHAVAEVRPMPRTAREEHLLRAMAQPWWPLAEEFLRVRGRGPSYLPPGLGWDGVETLARGAKAARLVRFLDRLGLADEHGGRIGALLTQALDSPARGLPTDWSKAEPLPEVLDTPARVWDGTAVDINQRTEWILIAPGRAEWLRPRPTSGEWGSNFAHSPRGEYRAEPQPMPDWVERAVRISVGAYTREHHSWGVAWKLFRRAE